MEQTAPTTGFKKPQLFLKKNVVVKFARTNSLMKGTKNLNLVTTTSIPTTIISSNGY